MIIGSEGRLGVITEVTAQVHRLPEKREILAYLFPSWHDGLAAMQAIAESDASPSVTRVSDAHETAFSFATSKAEHGHLAAGHRRAAEGAQGQGLGPRRDVPVVHRLRGQPRARAARRRLVGKIVKAKHGGIGVGKGPGKLYDQKKFDTPYLRDFLLDHGGAADVSETAAPWSKLRAVSTRRLRRRQPGLRRDRRAGLDHVPPVALVPLGRVPLLHLRVRARRRRRSAEYDVVKSAIQQAFIDTGGTLSHHHGVGLEHSPWMEQDVSTEGVAVMQGLFDSADPGTHFNPGKVTGV